MAVSADGKTILTIDRPLVQWSKCRALTIRRLGQPTARLLREFGDCVRDFSIDPTGSVVVTGDSEGVVRVGRIGGGEPQQLLGHKGIVQSVQQSPDGRWIASAGEDNTLRLWPMPDLTRPPLHALPHSELIATLKSLTNLRAVRDPDSPTGWKVEVGPFPGWKKVPTW
jgi:WD40 repeat protein